MAILVCRKLGIWSRLDYDTTAQVEELVKLGEEGYTMRNKNPGLCCKQPTRPYNLVWKSVV